MYTYPIHPEYFTIVRAPPVNKSDQKSTRCCGKRGYYYTIMPEQWVGGAQFRFLADFPFHTGHICHRLENMISPVTPTIFVTD